MIDYALMMPRAMLRAAAPCRRLFADITSDAACCFATLKAIRHDVAAYARLAFVTRDAYVRLLTPDATLDV